MKLFRTADRMRELIKTIPNPIFHLTENKNGVFVILKNKNGIVEYVYSGEEYCPNTKDIARKKYSDCLNLLIDSKKTKEKKCI